MVRYTDYDVAILYNPYHDRLGRFSTKTGSTTLAAYASVGSRAGQVTSSKETGLSNDDVKKIAREHERINKEVGKRVAGTRRANIQISKSLPTAGYYTPHNNTIHLGEDIARDLARGGQSARYVLIHEMIHARRGPTIDGGDRVNVKYLPRNQKGAIKAIYKEEALTSLLAERTYKEIYGRDVGVPRSYQRYAYTTASHYMRQANGDARGAWELLDNDHRAGYRSTQYYSQMESRYTGDSSAYNDLVKVLSEKVQSVIDKYARDRLALLKKMVMSPKEYDEIMAKVEAEFDEPDTIEKK